MMPTTRGSSQAGSDAGPGARLSSRQLPPRLRRRRSGRAARLGVAQAAPGQPTKASSSDPPGRPTPGSTSSAGVPAPPAGRVDDPDPAAGLGLPGSCAWSSAPTCRRGAGMSIRSHRSRRPCASRPMVGRRARSAAARDQRPRQFQPALHAARKGPDRPVGPRRVAPSPAHGSPPRRSRRAASGRARHGCANSRARSGRSSSAGSGTRRRSAP